MLDITIHYAQANTNNINEAHIINEKEQNWLARDQDSVSEWSNMSIRETIVSVS